MTSIINLYGDQLVSTTTGHGADISTQRADDLDMMAVELIRSAPGAPVVALDVGCGHGGQAARMAKAGAYVVAVDAVDYSAEVADSMVREGVRPGRFSFFRVPVESGTSFGSLFDVVVCQRMIHYLNHDAAQAFLHWLFRTTSSGGHLFLSASGIDSELGEGYAGKNLPLPERFAPLAQVMAEKHAIRPPVCLYRMDELADAVSAAGWFVENTFLSPFGNVKLVARKP